MKEISDKQIQINFNELNDLELIYNKKIGLTIFLDNVKYEFLLDLRSNSDELIVVGSGALGHKIFDRSRPYIERHSWNFKRSTIYYNDPTYYIDDAIRAGWCFGSKNNFYLKNISKILEILIKKLNLENRKVMFYGSSAGGFTSLVLSTFIKGTMCLVDIPQIYVNRYKSKVEQLDGWRDIKEQCFGDITDEEFLEQNKYRLNFVEISKKENYVPNAYLVLDCSVDLDFKTQYSPFFKEINQLPFAESSNWLKLIITGHGKGHVPITQHETINLIDKIFNDEINDTVTKLRSNFSASSDINVDLIVDKLEKYNTGRIDINVHGEGADLEIIEIDDYINISEPFWLGDLYSGFVITNKNNSIDFSVKCIGDSVFNIKLRGVHRKLNKKLTPIFINYTKCLINDENVLKENKVVFHDTPIEFNKNVKDGEIIKIHVEWLPY